MQIKLYKNNNRVIEENQKKKQQKNTQHYTQWNTFRALSILSLTPRTYNTILKFD